jgi:hypothetical protein
LPAQRKQSSLRFLVSAKPCCHLFRCTVQLMHCHIACLTSCLSQPS